MDYQDIICLLCGEALDADVVVVSRGLNTIVQSSLKRNDDVHLLIEGKQSITVHKKCRRDYTRPSSSSSSVSLSHRDTHILSTSTRQSVELFDFKINCFICGETALVTTKTPVERRKMFVLLQL